MVFRWSFLNFPVLVAGMDKGWQNSVVGKEYTMSEIQKAHIDLIKPYRAYGKMVLKII